MHKYQDEFDMISQRYELFKKQYSLPIKTIIIQIVIGVMPRKQITSTDFCGCYYAQIFIKNICFEIRELIGIEYIINF